MIGICSSCGGPSDRDGACVWCRLRPRMNATPYPYNPDALLEQIRTLIADWTDEPLTTAETDRLIMCVSELIAELDNGGIMPTDWAGSRRKRIRPIEDTPPLPDGPETAPESTSG